VGSSRRDASRRDAAVLAASLNGATGAVASFMVRLRARTYRVPTRPLPNRHTGATTEEFPMTRAILPAFAIASILSLGAVSLAAQATDLPNNDNDNTADMDSDQPVTDTWITTKVKTELATTEGVESMDIDVKTVNGVVTLTGVLDGDTAVKKAIAATQCIKGVKSVDSSGLKAR
jgi:hyperosmotically inducible protein